MSRYNMLIGKLDFEGCIGQCLNYNAFKLDYIILRQNNPSSALLAFGKAFCDVIST